MSKNPFQYKNINYVFSTTKFVSEITAVDNPWLTDYLSEVVTTKQVRPMIAPVGKYASENKTYTAETLKTGVSIRLNDLNNEDKLLEILVDLIEHLDCEILYIHKIEFKETKSPYHKKINIVCHQR